MWGCSRDDERGNILVELVVSLDLTSYNAGSSPTYVRYNAQSIVDVTFAQMNPGAGIINWQMRSNLNSESDHGYITDEILYRVAPLDIIGFRVARGWAARKLD